MIATERIKTLYLGYKEHTQWFPAYKINPNNKTSKLVPTNILKSKINSNSSLKEAVEEITELLKLKDEELLEEITTKYLNSLPTKQLIGLKTDANLIHYLARIMPQVGRFQLFPEAAPQDNNFYHYWFLLKPSLEENPKATELIAKIEPRHEFSVQNSGTSTDILFYGNKIAEVPQHINYLIQNTLYYLPEVKLVQINEEANIDQRILVEFSIKLDKPYENPIFAID